MKKSKKQRLETVAEQRGIIIEDSTKKSLTLINSEPAENKIAIENFRIIHEACLQLLTPENGKITCPDVDNVLSFLARHHPDCSVRTTRTLTNRYRRMLWIWQAAYDAILRLNIYNDGDWVDLKSSASMPHAGAFTEMQIRDEQIRRLNIAVNSLRAIILRMHSEGVGAIDLDPVHPRKEELVELASLRKWASQIGKKGSLLDLSEAGLKLTDRARINAVIMDRSTFEELQKLL